jgi:hypothetical protein
MKLAQLKKMLSFKAKYQKRQNQNKVSIEERKKNTNCKKCEKRGHWARECKSKQSKRDEGEARGKDSVAFISTCKTKNLPEKDTWILDSGATEHMTFREDWMEDIVMIKGGDVRIADDRRVPGIAKGNVKISRLIGKEWKEGILKEVLLVPGLGRNLFSVGAATNRGYQVIFRHDTVCIRSPDGTPAAYGHRENKLYKLAFKPMESACNEATSTPTQATIEVWHKRLSHVNHQYIQEMDKNNTVQGLKIETGKEMDTFCESCVYGKQHKKSFKEQNNRASTPGEKIHMDVCGPMKESSEDRGTSYYSRMPILGTGQSLD